jgi:glycopeptide antibiotics resistance protein
LIDLYLSITAEAVFFLPFLLLFAFFFHLFSRFDSLLVAAGVLLFVFDMFQSVLIPILTAFAALGK